MLVNKIKEQCYYDLHNNLMSKLILFKNEDEYTISFIKYDDNCFRSYNSKNFNLNEFDKALEEYNIRLKRPYKN